MTDSTKLLNLLYEAMAAETAATLFFIDHSLRCEHLGFERLSKRFRDYSLQAMKHYEAIIRRILYLGGKLEYRMHPTPPEIDDVASMAQEDLALTEAEINRLNEGIALAAELKDAGSRIVLEEILRDKERLYDELAKLIEQLSRFGEAYLVENG